MRDPFQGYDQWKTASPYDEDYWDEDYCCVCEEPLPQDRLDKGDAFCSAKCELEYSNQGVIEDDG